jgi:hypothetical protein
MAKWAIQCKAIPELRLLLELRRAELVRANWPSKGKWWGNIFDIYPEYPPKVVYRKVQKMITKGWLDYGVSEAHPILTEKGMDRLEKNGIYRWHSLNSMPTLPLSAE